MDNVAGVQESILVTFSGLVVEVNPTEIPAGSAAICTDCEFTVASVKTRAGLENVYVYDGADQTANPSAAANVTPPTGAVWSNPANIELNDPPNYATVYLNSSPLTPTLGTFANYGEGQSGGTVNMTVTVMGQAIAAGDVLLVLTEAYRTDSSYPAITSLTTSLGDRFLSLSGTSLNEPSPSGIHKHSESFYVYASTAVNLGGTFTLILTYSGSSNTLQTCYFGSVKNLGAIDQAPGTSSSGGGVVSGSHFSSGSMAVAQPDFLVSTAYCGNGAAPGNSFTLLGGTIESGDDAGFAYLESTIGTFSDLWNVTSGSLGANWASALSAFKIGTASAAANAEILQISAYGLTIPDEVQILGIQLDISGLQSRSSTVLSVTPIGGGTTSTLALQSTQSTVTIGGPAEFVGIVDPTPALLNNPSFGFNITASDASGQQAIVSLSGASLTVWYTPPGVENFTFVGTFAMTDGQTLTLALDDSGVFWQEDVFTLPDVLTPFFTSIEPGSYAKMAVIDDRAFLAISDLMQGTDVPRQYNGQWVDRISQIGPAAAPSVTSTSTGYDIVSITQPYSYDMQSDGESVLWSEGPTIQQAGNVVTLYFNNGTDISQIVVGSTIVLSGFGGPFAALNNTMDNPFYAVTSVGAAKPLLESNTTYPLITFTAPGTQLTSYTAQHQGTGDFGTVTQTLSQVTTTVPVPNLQVNSQMTIAGVTPGTWDGTWSVFATPNAAQLLINTTSLSGNVATYDYSIITGVAPTVGQQVTVTDTANGDGIFNVTNAVVSSTGASSFSISLISLDIPAAPETGNAIVNGTIFQFDPMQIIADGSGGNIVIAGGLGAGTRGCVVMFLTRNGLLTAPGAQAIFTLSADASQIIVTNLPIGPPNVISRVVAFTGAGGATQTGGGGFYFWIPEPVTVIDEGQTVVYTSTVVDDNTSTQATFNFTDAILLAGASISSQGSNNFQQIELGSCLGVIAYGLRLFGWGVENKIDNLPNYSFDGGIGSGIPPGGDGGSNIYTFPAGWTVDPTSQQGVSVLNSAIFGNELYVINNSGSTQDMWGLIYQSVYEDQLKQPILLSANTYSIRITAEIPSGNTTGNLVVDLYSTNLGTQWGSFTIPFSEMSQEMQIFTGTLLTTPFQQVPQDLVIRIYGTDMAAGADYAVDRIEPFITDEPVATTSLLGSYFNNFEAFDAIDGNLGVGYQNQQPIRCATELFDNLYIIKTKSIVSTTDNGITEPSGWTVREVSNKVGTPSINGIDVGEGWFLIAGQAGVYIFEGGQPVKISPEIDPLWNSINWEYGHTLWIRNDTNNRRFTIGVPMTTPNQWMPSFPTNVNPTKPNVILACDYKEILTAGALASEGPMRLAYTGELKTYAFGRKWSVWSIEAAYADFITRPDTTDQLFYCPDTDDPKIYQQIAGNYADDGEPMHCEYVTYPFPKPQEAQQQQMGLHQLIAHYMSLYIVGEGNARYTIYPDSLESPDADALYPEPLFDPPSYGDTEIPLNEAGNRFFVGVKVVDVDEWFELSKLVFAVVPDPWAPVRGSNM